MPRIKQDTCRKIKETVRISDVFEWLGARVLRKPRNTMAFCPFCRDANSKNPGCSLDDVQGLFYCFVCGASGDIFSAVTQHEHVNFPEAVELIGEQFNIPIEYEASDDPIAESRRKRLTSILERAQAEFVNQRTDIHYQDFLKQRNIKVEDAEQFELGISLYTEADALVDKLREEFTDDEIIQSGLCFMDEERGRPVLRFKNRLMFPIKTPSGALVAFGGRDLTGRSKAKYKNSPESELFKKRNVLYGMNFAKRAMAKSKRAIVCEGYMDTLALHTHGFPYAIGAMGTALTEYNLNRIASFAETIYISTDSDAAGIGAAMRTATTIPERFASEVKCLIIPEIECNSEEEVRKASPAKADEYLYKEVPVDPANPQGETRKVAVDFPIMVPLAKDPDEFFNQAGHTHEEFEELLEKAPDIFLFCAMMKSKEALEAIEEESAKDAPDLARLSNAKQKAKRDIGDFIAEVFHKTNIYQRQNIANFMIARLGLVDSAETLEREWATRAAQAVSKNANSYSSQYDYNAPDDISPVFTSKTTEEEDLLIATLYYHPECRKTIKQNLEDIEMVFTSDVRLGAFKKIDEAYGKAAQQQEVLDELTEAEKREASRIIMQAAQDKSMKERLSDATIVDICRKIERHAIENKIEYESNAAEPDIMKIIDLKTRLQELG